MGNNKDFCDGIFKLFIRLLQFWTGPFMRKMLCVKFELTSTTELKIFIQIRKNTSSDRTVALSYDFEIARIG